MPRYSKLITAITNGLEATHTPALPFSQLVESSVATNDETQGAPAQPAFSDQREEKAARIIQSAWRRHRFDRQISVNAYQAVLETYSDAQDRALSQRMLGRTNAVYAKPARLDFVPVNPQVRQKVTSEIGYYRTDPLSTLENLDDLIAVYDAAADLSLYDYIPITLSRMLSVEAIVAAYTPEFVDKITILKHPTDLDSPFAFIRISKRDSQFFHLKKILTTLGIYSGNFISKVASLGMKSSYWQLALQKQRHTRSDESHSTSLPQYPLPTTVRELKESARIDKLRALVLKASPTKYLAKTLLSLIDHIDDDVVLNEEALKRIALFIDLAAYLYEKNYDKFALILYYVIHELTLLFNRKEITLDYKKFLEVGQVNIARTLGLPENHPNLRYVAFPANSGTNALMLALDVAKKANQGNVAIRTEGPLYFEFDRLQLAQVTSDSAAHDIYLITSGPTVWKGIYPGLDLNKIIRERVSQEQIKPITLVVDATSGMHRNLVIDEDLKKYFLDGTVSILVNESHQKFGLGHSDQAQYGYVFGVCSTLHYSTSSLDAYEERAEVDLQKNIDMQIGAYLTQCAELPLEKIKEAHFKNGALLRQFLSSMKLAKDNFILSPQSLDDPERGLFIHVNSFSSLAKIIKKHFVCRDSFGHFNTTWCECGPFTRLTVSASDAVDLYIEASEIYFASAYSEKEMVSELSRQVMKLNQTGSPYLSTAEQIALMGLMQTLTHLQYQPKNVAARLEWALAIKYLREYCPEIRGRRSYQALLELEERQFQQMKQDFVASVLHKISKKSLSQNRIQSLRVLLKEYAAVEEDKKQRHQLLGLRAAIILQSHGHLSENNLVAKKSLVRNKALSKAIIALDQWHALSNFSCELIHPQQRAITPTRLTSIHEAVYSLAQLINKDGLILEGNQEEKFKELLARIQANNSFAETINMLYRTRHLLSMVEQRSTSSKLPAAERLRLRMLRADLEQLKGSLHIAVQQGASPSFNIIQHQSMTRHIQEYINSVQSSNSAFLKRFLVALKNLLKQILPFLTTTSPSRGNIADASQAMINRFTLFQSRDTSSELPSENHQQAYTP